MGSLSDYEIIKPGVDLIESWGVPYEILVASAHRTPERVARWTTEAEARGLQTIIAAAGMAAHLPGVVTAHTTLPVIGLPIEAGALAGQDSLYAIVQMPPGIPVATVGINGAINAAVLALQILARSDAQWEKKLKDYRAGMGEKIDQQNAKLKLERPGAIWGETEFGTETPPVKSGVKPSSVAETLVETPRRGVSTDAASHSVSTETAHRAVSTKPSVVAAGTSRASYVGRVAIESDLMPVEVVEQAVDCLLEGGIIAMPTDTVYGLAADATNEEAVRRLYALKGRAPNRAIAIFIDSQRPLASLVRNLTPEIRAMLEAFWPGPLTVVMEKQGRGFAHLASGSTIGVRIPDHSVPLTLMQELRRPVACTSANPTGEPEARNADEIAGYFGQSVDMILDAGVLPTRSPSTVIDVTETPYRVVREGAISKAQLAAVVGDLIQTE